MRRGSACVGRCVLVATLVGGLAGVARADGLTGISAYGTVSGMGANATTGIPFGPSQRSRRPPLPPRQLPPAPSGAIPAAAPPRDPVFGAGLLDDPPLVEPIELTAPHDGATPQPSGFPPSVVPPGGPVFPRVESAPIAPPPAPPAPAVGYGSPSLGYGPAVSYAPRPSITPDSLRLPASPMPSGPAVVAPDAAPLTPSAPTSVPFGTGAVVGPPLPPAPSPVPRPSSPGPEERMPSWDDVPDGPDRRLYLSSILGADFGTLSVGNGPNANDPLFTTGGAVGMAYERPQGWLRTEFEARYRDPVSTTVIQPALGGSASVTGRDGWSTMINAWRDLEVTDRVALYLGGGIGGGGYTVAFDGGFPALGAKLSGSTSVTGFAWQAGGGASWLVTERVALDLGYRWYAVDGGPATIDVTTPIFSFSDSFGTQFGASELLFSLRVYEPFRRWGP